MIFCKLLLKKGLGDIISKPFLGNLHIYNSLVVAKSDDLIADFAAGQ